MGEGERIEGSDGRLADEEGRGARSDGYGRVEDAVELGCEVPAVSTPARRARVQGEADCETVELGVPFGGECLRAEWADERGDWQAQRGTVRRARSANKRSQAYRHMSQCE